MTKPKHPNERDCEHGSLKRSCQTCELEREIKALRNALYNSPCKCLPNVEIVCERCEVLDWRRRRA